MNSCTFWQHLKEQFAYFPGNVRVPSPGPGFLPCKKTVGQFLVRNTRKARPPCRPIVGRLVYKVQDCLVTIAKKGSKSNRLLIKLLGFYTLESISIVSFSKSKRPQPYLTASRSKSKKSLCSRISILDLSVLG
jgi:hypothetical protein